MRRLASLILAIALTTGCTVQFGNDAATTRKEQRPDSAPTAAQQQELHLAAKAVAVLMDAGEYGQAWDMAGPTLQDATPRVVFATTMTARSSFGAAVARKILGFGLFNHLEGAPPGHYGVIVVRTDFEHVKGVEEKFVFQQLGSQWKLAGYWLTKKTSTQ